MTCKGINNMFLNHFNIKKFQTKNNVMAYDENIYARIISGELSKEEEEALRKSGEWDEIQEILDVSSTLNLPSHDANKGYERLRLEQNEKRKEGKTGKVRRMYYIMGSVAAVLVLGFAYLFLIGVEDYISNAGYGEIAEVVLKDNTKVTLNDGSTLDYEQFIENEARNVSLEGEAYFEVVPGNKFKVTTENGTVEVLGTAFNVRDWGSGLIVECFEGKVAVRTPNVQRELPAGEAVSVKDGHMTASNISAARPLWMDGLSRFEDVPLNEVMEEVERQYDVDISIPDIDRPFSGAFRHDDLQNALSKICDPMGLTFSFTDEKSVVISE